MKKISVICMILSLVAGLFGCSKGPWQSLTYHVTSSVLAEGCHFNLSRDADGSMSLSGYCFDGETEYRNDEAKQVMQETASAITAMELDGASNDTGKLFQMADGTQVSVTLGYADGSERRISLSAQQQEQLKQLLQKELVSP